MQLIEQLTNVHNRLQISRHDRQTVNARDQKFLFFIREHDVRPVTARWQVQINE